MILYYLIVETYSRKETKTIQYCQRMIAALGRENNMNKI